MLEAAFKYLASYFKSDWSLRDYPLRFRHQTAEDSEYDFGPSYKLVPWSAQIINWWQMGGEGDTKEEAYVDLEQKFREFKTANAKLPRPGTGAPWEFAATDELEGLYAVAADFFEKVLELGEDDSVGITDGSSLYDFEAFFQPVDVSLEKIREVYGIDVSDVEGYNLARIFARIAETRTSVDSEGAPE